MRFRLALLPLLLAFVPACNTKPAPPVVVSVDSPIVPARLQKSAPGAYKSEEGRFAVNFPKEPSIANKELATSAGVLKVQTAKVDGGKDLMYSVSHTTYPPSYGEVDPAKILDGVRDGLKGQDGELKSDKATTAGEDKHPAREVRIDAGKNGIRARLILVDRKLIQVMVVGAKDTLDGPTVEEFFKSFELALK